MNTTVEGIDVLDERVGVLSERIRALCLRSSDQKLPDEMQKRMEEVFR